MFIDCISNQLLFIFIINIALLILPLYLFFHTAPPPPPLIFNQQLIEPCPICLVEYRQLCITRCQHVFCVKCLLNLWEKEQHRQIPCPICRQPITEIKGALNISQQNENKVMKFNYFQSGNLSLCDRVFSRFFMTYCWRSFKNMISSPKSLLIAVIVKIGLLIGYLILPWDLLPQSVLGAVGLIDDLLIMVIFIFTQYRILSRYN